MNQNDIRFKKTALNIGAVLLIFVALYFVAFGQIYALFSTLINFLISKEEIANIITEIISGILYFAMFMIPALIYIPLSKKTRFTNSVKVKPSLKFKTAVPIIFASIAITTAAAYVNTILCSFFEISNEIIDVDEHVSLAKFIVYTVTLAVVPAICEEFLFRKTILGALSPYGEDFAIVTSAVLFGLMHQNILQIFYATMAGIVIGYAYVKTRSFLCVFLIHFTNNFISVIQQTVYANLSEASASIFGAILMAAIAILGIISVVTLIVIEKSTSTVYQKGSFGTIDVPALSYKRAPLALSRVKLFYLTPTVLIFIIISIILCIITLVL